MKNSENNRPIVGDIRIALVDDHEMVRQGIKDLIHTFSPQFKVVMEASDGRQFIRQLEQCGQIPDVCLLDMFMRGLNGLDTLLIVKKRWPDMKVLVVSGNEEDHHTMRMIQEGANGVLSKRSGGQILKEAIEAVCRKGVYHSELAGRQLFESMQKGRVKLPVLTHTELQVLELMAEPMKYDEIAKRLQTSSSSICNARDSLFRKIGTHDRTAAVVFAIRNGLLLVDRFDTDGRNFYQKGE